MRRFYIIGFLILLVFDTMAQVAFKLGAMSTAPAACDIAWLLRVVTEKWVYVALVGYLGAFVTYMTLLKHAPIGPAFAVSHLELVIVLIVSVLFLNEHLNAVQVVGSLLICAGIVVFAIGKRDEEKQEEQLEKKVRQSEDSKEDARIQSDVV